MGWYLIRPLITGKSQPAASGPIQGQREGGRGSKTQPIFGGLDEYHYTKELKFYKDLFDPNNPNPLITTVLINQKITPITQTISHPCPLSPYNQPEPLSTTGII